MDKENVKLVEIEEDYLKNVLGNTDIIRHTDTNKIIGTLLENGSIEVDLKYSNHTLTLSNVDKSKIREVKLSRSIYVPQSCLEEILYDVKNLNNIEFVKGAMVIDNYSPKKNKNSNM